MNQNEEQRGAAPGGGTDEVKQRRAMGRLFHSWRFLVCSGVIAVIAGGLGWWYLSRWESTDDAQIDGHINPVSARISGQVIGVNFEDNQFVKAGRVLVQIDRTGYEVTLNRAEAEYANARALATAASVTVPITATAVRSQLATAQARVDSARAGVVAAEKQQEASRALLHEAEANKSRDQADLARYAALIATGAVSRQDYDRIVARAKSAAAAVDAGEAALQAVGQQVTQAREVLKQAQADLVAARTAPQQIAVSRARSESAAATAAQARGALAQARLDLGYTDIAAPVDGIVGRKSVEKGQYVQPGQQLFVIVPVNDIWVTANFKENQLERMRPGQSVRIKVDAYGSVYTGRVASIGGASGARFSLFPPENATGNYVKVVQRVPVRIEIDQGQDREHLLRPGMSVTPRVRVR